MVLPPLSAGGVNVTDADPLPAVAEPMVGAPGTLASAALTTVNAVESEDPAYCAVPANVAVSESGGPAAGLPGTVTAQRAFPCASVVAVQLCVPNASTTDAPETGTAGFMDTSDTEATSVTDLPVMPLAELEFSVM